MGEIKLYGGREENALEQVLNLDESGFDEKEKLIAKSILGIKAIFALEDRLSPVLETFLANNEKMFRYTAEFASTLNQVTNWNRNLAKEYAERLDISKERFEEITKYVYSRTTNL